MKKRYYLVPAICLITALLSAVVMTLFSTTFIAQKYTYADDTSPNREKNLRKYSEIAYKLDKNYNNLEYCATAYMPEFYIFVKEKVSELPLDYAEKCVKYNTEMYNLPVEKYAGMSNIISVSGDVYSSTRFRIEYNYLLALYFTGQTEKAKQEAEKLINDFEPEYEFDYSYYYSFLNFVYCETNNEAEKAWASEMRDKLFYKMEKVCPGKYIGENSKYYIGFSPYYRD